MTAADLLGRTLILFGAGGLLMALGGRARPPAEQRKRWLKFATFFVIVHGVLALAAIGRGGVVGLVLLVLAGATTEAAGAWRAMRRPRPLLLPVLAAAVTASAVVAAAKAPPASVAWLFLTCAAFDGFSQVTGQWLGRTPLAPRISPAKTVEGALGGFAGAAGVALWLRGVAPNSAGTALLLGMLTAAAALSGDLAGSWTKRRAGLKDFSTRLPGHGGVLDRFNSFLTALALVGIWL